MSRNNNPHGHTSPSGLDDDDDDELSEAEMVEAVLDDPERFINSINKGTQQVLDRSRIEIEFDVGRRRSKRIKCAVLAELDRELI
jgi:hypothetical protein